MFKGGCRLSKVRRDEFTPEEYRKLHTFARGWIKEARNQNVLNTWYRTIAYNFVLVMTNTGMRRGSENLRWRDVAVKTDKQGRKFVILRVRGKGKFRQLVAAGNVADIWSASALLASHGGRMTLCSLTMKVNPLSRSITISLKRC